MQRSSLPPFPQKKQVDDDLGNLSPVNHLFITYSGKLVAKGGLGGGQELMSLALPQECHFAGASRLLYLAQNPRNIHGVLAGSAQSI